MSIQESFLLYAKGKLSLSIKTEGFSILKTLKMGDLYSGLLFSV
jgi:hypothetical protein